MRNFILFFALIIELFFSSFGQVSPKYFNYTAPSTSSGTIYQHPRPTTPDNDDWTQFIYPQPNYTITKSEPPHSLGFSYSQAREEQNGDLKYFGNDLDGNHIYITGNRSKYQEYSLYFYYTFKGGKVIEVSMIMSCSKYEQYAKKMYDSFITLYLNEYDQEYYYKEPNNDAVVLMYSYFAIAFQYYITDSAAVFHMSSVYR